jgi:acyl-homoserine lactone synthase
MIKLHVVTAANRHLYDKEMEEFLRLRHDMFAKERHWVPEDESGQETDAFDTNDATYLLGLEDGAVITSARLIPTALPHLVSENFESLCERGLPRRWDWAEWTRTMVVPSRRGGGHKGVTGILTVGVMEYCLEEGIDRVGGVQEFYHLTRYAELGWDTEVLGLPQDFNGERYVVAYCKCGEAELATARKVTGVDYPVLARRGEQRPFIPTDQHPQPGA